ncbi:MAG: type II toxin-antitoxin system PrlF family antitoxin [Phenylobacterium sp.]|uniref:type II toxin-antitoxin system PrlF family antitoxin n=1 Tax=Phenylobacterium sp. TaxID=1871053 RepID=UPI00271F66C3|nr:type II toxin-antitoxin system PrlF family antitoxin [Phenylobacterium sp.]MDO8900073.1 type II toxin-antitoxin system PrlF family antitoxin [Phenylobacterium sp.]MDP2213438.1 type II toxin-antitoxin system PrlF family antitoxin [Phenylobacterium sp.]
MSTLLEEVSTITAKGQTTIPKSVRQALGVDYGDKISFRVDERGVSVHRVDVEHDDEAISGFLTFLAEDIVHRPERLSELSPELAARLTALAGDTEVDLDAPIDGAVDL